MGKKQERVKHIVHLPASLKGIGAEVYLYLKYLAESGQGNYGAVYKDDKKLSYFATLYHGEEVELE